MAEAGASAFPARRWPGGCLSWSGMGSLRAARPGVRPGVPS